ncbi:MAG TPA: SCP2 sterol-binding domain-containing protein [Candidatus Binatia bacterium]
MAEEITVAEFFEKVVPEGFAAEAQNAQDEATLCYVVTGDGGGEWTLKVAGGKMTVERGKPENALVTYTVSAKDALDAINARNGAAPALIVPPRRQGSRSGMSPAVKALRGTVEQNLTRPDGDPFKIEICFNGAATPRAKVTVALADQLAMAEGKMNPQEAFMTGKLKIEGDMGFMMQVGMALQS